MKKGFVFAIVLTVFVTTLAFNVRSASARNISRVPVVAPGSSYFEFLCVCPCDRSRTYLNQRLSFFKQKAHYKW